MSRTSLLVRVSVASLAAAHLTLGAAAAAPAVPGVGDRAPAFTLLDLSGAPRSPAALEGRVLVLYFAMWCSTCRANTLELEREVHQPWRDRGVLPLAVDYLGNDREELRALVQDLGLTYPVLLDDGTLVRAFGGRMAFTLVIDRGGVIRYADFYDLQKVKAVVAALAGGDGPPPAPALAGAAPPPRPAPPPRTGAEPAGPAWKRPAQSFHGRAPSEYLGISILAGPTDLDGDGQPDLAVGSQAVEGGGGAVSVWYGGARGLGAEPDLRLTGSRPGQRVGGSLAAADVNGDGVKDLVVGDGWAKGRERAVSIHLGGRGGLAREPAWTMRRPAGGDDFGGALAAGDLDGDGLADLAVGLHTADGRGALSVHYGRAGGLPPAPDAVLRGDARRDGFGSSITVADLDADGRGELVVGAPGVNGGGTDRGAVYVYLGRRARLAPAPPAREADLVLVGEGDMDELGSLVTAAGDLNSDGHPELALAAPGSGRGGRRAGAVYLVRGPLGRDGPLPRRRAVADAAGQVLADGAAGALFGVSVAPMGDLDGDGIDDLAVGAMNAQDDPARGGAVYLYRGARQGALGPPVTVLGTQEDGRFGREVASLGGGRFAVTETGDATGGRGAGAVHLFTFPRAAEEVECSRCGMPLDRYRHTRYEVAGEDGTRRAACGAHCGLRMEAELRERGRAATATDFISGRPGEAGAMFYVFGSEAVPEMWPSFIAFASRADAERFQRGFGGEVLDHAAALERARGMR